MLEDKLGLSVDTYHMLLQNMGGLVIIAERTKCFTQSDGKMAIMIGAHNQSRVWGRQNSGSQKPKKELE